MAADLKPSSLPIAAVHARFATELSMEDISALARQNAIHLILDAVACAYAATGGPLEAALDRWLGPPLPTGAAVFGRQGGYAPHAAAIANGSLIHALDFDDIPHFSAVELPPLMALAETTEATGRDVIVAIVAGFEVAARITAQLKHGGVQHPIGLVGPICSAVASARLLGATQDEMTVAIAIAASTGAGILQNFGTFTKPLHAGRAAESGLLAAELARAGWTADPAALEGPKGFFAAFCDAAVPAEVDYSDLWIARLPADGSGGSGMDPTAWPPRHSGSAGDQTLLGKGAPPDLTRGGPNLRRGPSFKPWPACGGNNAVLTAAFELFAHTDREQIRSLRVVVPSDPRNGALFRTEPHDGLQGKFSLAYGAASAWLDGEVTVASYTDDAYARVSESGLLSRVDVVVDPHLIETCPSPPDDPACNWAAVVAEMQDGSEQTGWAFNRGVELAPSAITAKFLEFTVPALGNDRAQDAMEAILGLADAPSWRNVVAVFAGDTRS